MKIKKPHYAPILSYFSSSSSFAQHNKFSTHMSLLENTGTRSVSVKRCPFGSYDIDLTNNINRIMLVKTIFPNTQHYNIVCSLSKMQQVCVPYLCGFIFRDLCFSVLCKA